jgi:hypothetical protein
MPSGGGSKPSQPILFIVYERVNEGFPKFEDEKAFDGYWLNPKNVVKILEYPICKTWSSDPLTNCKDLFHTTRIYPESSCMKIPNSLMIQIFGIFSPHDWKLLLIANPS